MTIPVRGTVDNASKVAAELDERFTQFYRDLKAWRDRVNANNGTDSWDAATGEPAYRKFGPDNQLVSFPVPFTGPQKTSILSQIDAVLATFTPV